MPLAPEIKSFLETAAAAGLPQVWEAPIDVIRRNTQSRPALAGTPEPLFEVTNRFIPGPTSALPIRIYRPSKVSDRTIVYFHGGGYVVQSANSHRKVAAHLALQSNRNVLSVNYRLAPEHAHPAAVNDAVLAYQWLLNAGYASNKIAVSGDSAGGGLSVALMVALKNQKIEQPAGAVVFSPWVDLEGTGESMDSKASVDLMVDRHALALMANMFIAGGSLRDPLAAPLYADLAGIAPLYIQVGGDEALLDDSTRLATRAAHAGVPVRLEVFPEMQHVFQSGVGVIPEANDAVARAGQWLQGILS